MSNTVSFNDQGREAMIRSLSHVYNGDDITAEDYKIVGKMLTVLYNTLEK